MDNWIPSVIGLVGNPFDGRISVTGDHFPNKVNAMASMMQSGLRH